MGGTMRLGADPVKLHDGTRAREIYGEAVIYERHRHRYEVNNHAAPAARGRGPGRAAAPRPTSAWSRSSSCPTTRSSSPRSSTPSSSRGPTAPAAAVPRVRRRRARARRARRADGASRAATAEAEPAPRRAASRAARAAAAVSGRRRAARPSAAGSTTTFVRALRDPEPDAASERAVADAVAAELRALGLEVDEDDAAGRDRRRRAATCSRALPGPRASATVLLCAHLDTVPHRRADRGRARRRRLPQTAGDDDPRRRQQGRGGGAARARAPASPPSGAPVGVELLFTVAEENGLRGRQGVRRSRAALELRLRASTTRRRSAR